MKNFLFLSLAITFFLIPFENARVVLFGVPIYLVEIGVMVSIGALLFLRKQSKPPLGNMRIVETQNFASLRYGVFFLFVGILSSLVAAIPDSAICPLSHEGLLRALGILKSWFLFPILFGYVLFHASHTYFSREKLIFIFLVSFLPISILSLLGWLFGSHITYDGRLTGIFNSPNALAMHLTPAIILSWYFFRSKKCIMYHVSCIILLLFLLFFTRSYSAWIAIGVGILVFEFFRAVIPAKAGIPYLPAGRQSPPAKHNISTNKACKILSESWWNLDLRFPCLPAGRREDDTKKRSILKYGLLFLFVVLLVSSQWNHPRFENFFDPDSRSSFASRLMIWRSAAIMIADSPIFGVGPGNFQSCYLSYQQYFPPYLEWSVPEPHNVFLAFWLGSGLIGLLAFGFLLLRWFQTLSRRIQKGGDALLLALTAIMIAILIHGLVDTTYWRLGLSYLFWVVFFTGISSSCHSRLRGNDEWL